MFGSISNWINTNIPQVQQVGQTLQEQVQNVQHNVQQQVQNVQQAMPPVSMPDFFGKNKQQQQNGEELQTIEKKDEEAAGTANLTDAAVGGDNNAPSQVSNEPTDVKANGEANATGEANEVGAALENTETKSGMNIKIDAQKALGTATEIGSNIGNMLFSFGKTASSNVMKTATQLKDVIEKTSIIGDFNKENEKFVNEKKTQQRREEAAVPPWVGFNQEEKLKQEILELSTDSRNFLRCPPPGVDFPFDFNSAYPVALATLEEDPNLKDMRFKLVPGKITEENFWRNYLYRVSLIKQSFQLEELNSENNQIFEHLKKLNADDDPSEIKDSHQSTSSVPSSPRPPQPDLATSNANEFVSDSLDHEAISADEINSDLKQLNLKNEKKADLEDTDWDKELPEDLDNISAEELEKEINQMIGRN